MTTPGCQPIIILGMHRSGTTLVAGVLEQLGLYLGARKDHNREARFFLEINDWLLRESGGSWNAPEPVLALLEDERTRDLYRARITSLAGSLKALSFLGVWHRPAGSELFAMKRPWGWKDPRNTFTLPIWLDLFPDAKIIYVARHGVDVAASIVQRRDKWLEHVRAHLGRYRGIPAILPLKARLGAMAGSPSLEDAFQLWCRYTKQAQALVDRLGRHALELRYEDFLDQPARTAQSLAEFCRVRCNEASVASATSCVCADRAYAYRRDPTLRTLARQKAGELGRYGYDD